MSLSAMGFRLRGGGWLGAVAVTAGAVGVLVVLAVLGPAAVARQIGSRVTPQAPGPVDTPVSGAETGPGASPQNVPAAPGSVLFVRADAVSGGRADVVVSSI